MSNEAVEILVIADRSGSMDLIRDDAIGGFNTFIENQKDVEGDANLTLVLFNDNYDVVLESENIHKVEPLDETTFVPMSMTAMNDAIGKAVASLKEKNPTKAIVCILTDGADNCSCEYSNEQIKKLMEEIKGKGWEVVFLAANIDAFSAGATRGITTTVSYSATGGGIRGAYDSVSSLTSSYRTNSDQ